ncbi:Fur family transcriptional regulator [Thermosipho sp. (in: thermotogales)]|jgi:Fur family ferric uptake transcriptional regulator|uniref:Fur family transcriptional regulator n=1 Tax=Thermosipho sp. (in: thermotogales) TaxID=1968895 RepID=UPI00257DF482|nr:Fur family transcriptional regulator [Thermosipho sp. (in: thermotogales)]MBZ4650144.1 Fur family transcriptional regulator [Thermosipho sp. (in: thermotogales)]MDK2839014.1 Fur family transcriptional regulator, ferric uptake regulator [Thermosipho sp. (in: thermotogales)]MDK2901039.1 Fur family transcriptional regulator, ferric uptake regulator [Thermosipho sp. (in: thermotogales)]
MYIETLKKELKNKKYRMTPQRELVLKVFIDNESKHLGAEDVYRLLFSNKHTVSKATVYRTIDLLVEFGLLRKIDFGDGIYRYELAKKEKMHHHFICKICGKIYEIEEKHLEIIKKELLSQGFQFEDFDFKIYGICPKCSKKAKNKTENKK